jgi:hypothetical protein
MHRPWGSGEPTIRDAMAQLERQERDRQFAEFVARAELKVQPRQQQQEAPQLQPAIAKVVAALKEMFPPDGNPGEQFESVVRKKLAAAGVKVAHSTYYATLKHIRCVKR